MKLKLLAEKFLSSKYGHWISLCTNFSASLQDYCKFVEVTEGRLYKFAFSLHTEYDEPRAFFEKCKKIKNYLPKDAKIQVHNVIPRGVNQIVKLGKIKEMFDSENILFYTDLLVDDNGKYITYTSEEIEAINTCLGVEERLFVNTGKRCRAGESYFVLLPNLDAWTCWEVWYADDKKYYLGNMMDGTFLFRNEMTICPFETCSCPTPVFKDNTTLQLMPTATLMPKQLFQYLCKDT